MDVLCESVINIINLHVIENVLYVLAALHNCCCFYSCMQEWDEITDDPTAGMGDSFDFVQYDSEIKALQEIIKHQLESIEVTYS